jgi:hypothetical protein
MPRMMRLDLGHGGQGRTLDDFLYLEHIDPEQLLAGQAKQQQLQPVMAGEPGAHIYICQ